MVRFGSLLRVGVVCVCVCVSVCVCVEGWLPLVQVALGGLWVVSDGFCWLRVTSDGFRWFAVLVVTSISQHTEHLALDCTHGRT